MNHKLFSLVHQEYSPHDPCEVLSNFNLQLKQMQFVLVKEREDYNFKQIKFIRKSPENIFFIPHEIPICMESLSLLYIQPEICDGCEGDLASL